MGCSTDDNHDGGGEKPQPGENTALSLVDKQATEETKALYSNLWSIQEQGVMFGHHDALLYGRNWYVEHGRSDIKDVVGDYPAVFSVDFAELMDDRYATAELNEHRVRTIKESRRRGEVILANAHLNNPLTGGDSWDNSRNDVVKEILIEGSPTNQKYLDWLDRLAAVAHSLVDDNGKPIPVIFRPYHEHNQTWSWWGRSATTQQEFIDLWRFTIDYLKNEKEVHNFIYAISPQLDQLGSKENLLFRWPGDNYVDFLGMDSYHGTNTAAFSSNLRNLAILSQEKNKPSGVTETGIEGILGSDGETYEEYWTREIGTPLAGKKISMVVMWRNKYDPSNTGFHFFAPFEGHSSAPDFQKFFAMDHILFSSDLPEMYEMVNGIDFN
ncbi:glycosyl hydrolase [Salinimicrobium sp. MT39]|uniref:Glycosyl hydrolase n=1 Tax=Salinimicrobium profundisediminis TaxID=2994553 RepID=A0A9X3I0I2_9FLAO|nr:glycosyl hydrolase [Salinimicrobium profundisediminis]MCX2837861.1 glycosyl hydrolase [Salinimicrobium profundisediminis]